MCVCLCVHTHAPFLICVCTIVLSVCTEAAESVQIRAWPERVPEILSLIQRMLEEVRPEFPLRWITAYGVYNDFSSHFRVEILTDVVLL